MTEPLFLCETIWIVVCLVEWRTALDEEAEATSYTLPSGPATHHASHGRIAGLARHPLHVFEAPGPRRGAWLRNPLAPLAPRTNIPIAQSTSLQVCIAAALVAAIFTRYDGWIIALIAWTVIGLTLLKHAAEGERGRLASPAFWLASFAVVAAPVLWFLYNSVSFGDWLYFARGPFSAKAIELRTAATAPGWPPHPGWHNPWVALLYFLKVSELDSVAAPGWGSFWGNVVLILAAFGTTIAGFAKKFETSRHALAWTLLLWLPVPFYTWSVAYGSVPIFFPAWWPYTLYNTRYGLELLPAFALGLGFTAELGIAALRRIKLPRTFPFLSRFAPFMPRVAFALFSALAGLNVFALLRADPMVYVESTKNADARLPYDANIPQALQGLLMILPRTPVLMNTSTYPEIVSLTGIPLRQTINESDLGIFRAALAAPATHAAIIVAFDGDEVDRAVKTHPANLTAFAHFTAKNQPAATVYLSTWWLNQTKTLF